MTDDNIIWGDALKHQSEFNYLPAMLKKICYTAAFLSRTLYGEKLHTTSVFRKRTSDSGIHAAYRAIDFKPLENMVNTYRFIEIVNSIFTYDPSRPALKVVHENPYHGTGAHLHFQVHDKTCYTTAEQSLRISAQITKDSQEFQPQALKA